MKWIILKVLATAVCLTGLCLCAILIGRLVTHENPLLKFGISNCHDEFCFNGIQAGVTEWESAKTLLSIQFGAFEGDSITVSQAAFQVDYWEGIVDNKVHVQVKATSAPLLSLGDLLLINYEEPCSLTLTAESIYIQYSGFAAELPIPYDIDDMRHTLLTPHAPITALLFFENPPCDTPILFPSSRNIPLRWCGFITLGQYIERCRLPGLILLPS